jgi:chromosome segregation ATPase
MSYLPEGAPGELALREDVERLSERLEALRISIEARLEGIEHEVKRIGGLEQRIGGLEQRIGGLEQRIDRLEQRMDRLEQRFDAMSLQLVEVVRAVEGSRADFRADLSDAIIRSNRTTVLAMVGTIVGSVSLSTVIMATFGA